MSIKQIVEILTNSGIEPNEANAEVKLLIEHFCGFNAMDIVFGRKLDENKLKIVEEKALYRARTKEPIQHIIGWGYFMGKKYDVNKNVLIPRDETELLVRKAVKIINQNSLKKVLDIGTGTGCIACSIAWETDVQVVGVDISSEALQTALNNAAKQSLFNRAIFRKSDIFSNVKPDEKFDIIVSNPPYIPLKDKATLQTEVTFDPELALFTNDDKGIEFYEKICKDAKLFLNPNGFIAFEIGYGQSDDVRKIIEKYGFKNIQIEKDLAQIDRVISAQIN